MRLSIGIVLLCAHAAHAQNLVPNPDFDTGVEPWQMVPGAIGTVTHVPDDGSPAPGALRLERPDESNRGSSTAAISACMPVDADTRFDLIGSVKLVVGNSASVQVTGYSSVDCSGSIVSFDPVLSTQAADGLWHSFSATDFPLPDTVGSVVVRLNSGVAFPATQSVALFDHIGFGPTGSVPVTLQSFRID